MMHKSPAETRNTNRALTPADKNAKFINEVSEHTYEHISS